MNVQLQVSDHVARVTINRPEVLNAIDQATEQELRALWDRLEDDRQVRVIVVTGAGDRAFCVGADLKGAVAGEEVTGLDYLSSPRPGGFAGLAMSERLLTPVVARVNGYVLGGGMEMLLGCDIAVACAEAQFGFPEPRVGRLPLDGGMTLLTRQIPNKAALGLLLTGRRIDAAEAERLGLVNEVVDRAQLDEAVDRWVRQILACAPLATRAIKQVIRETSHLSIADAAAQRLPATIAAVTSEDADEGVQSFVEKRAPHWKGC